MKEITTCIEPTPNSNPSPLPSSISTIVQGPDKYWPIKFFFFQHNKIEVPGET